MAKISVGGGPSTSGKRKAFDLESDSDQDPPSPPRPKKKRPTTATARKSTGGQPPRRTSNAQQLASTPRGKLWKIKLKFVVTDTEQRETRMTVRRNADSVLALWPCVKFENTRRVPTFWYASYHSLALSVPYFHLPLLCHRPHKLLGSRNCNGHDYRNEWLRWYGIEMANICHPCTTRSDGSILGSSLWGCVRDPTFSLELSLNFFPAISAQFTQNEWHSWRRIFTSPGVYVDHGGFHKPPARLCIICFPVC